MMADKIFEMNSTIEICWVGAGNFVMNIVLNKISKLENRFRN